MASRKEIAKTVFHPEARKKRGIARSFRLSTIDSTMA